MRTLATTLVAAAAAAVVSPTSLSAQLQVDGLSGVGRATFGPIDVNTPAATNGALGVVHLNNEIFVSTRGNGASTTAPHTVYVYDMAGNLTRQFTQGTHTSSSAWGWRDGDTDGQSLIFGFEGGIHVVDVNGNLVNQVIAASGTIPITQPIPTGRSVSRAIAYDPAGNGGNGSLFVGDFGSAINEVALDGTILRTFATPSSPNEWSAYGLAIDPATFGANQVHIWINSAPNASGIKEYVFDRTAQTATPTGNVITRSDNGSAQGGLDIVVGGLDGRNCGIDLIGLDQATPDTITGYRLDLWNGWKPSQEAQLLTGADGGALTPGVQRYEVGTNTSFEFDLSKPGLLYVVFLTGNPTAFRPVGPVSIFKEAWEWRMLTPFTTPSGFAVATASLTSGTPVSFGSAVMDPLAPVDFLMQAMVIDPAILGPVTNCGGFLPLSTTNLTGVEVRNAPRYLVQANGTNSFNSVTTSGFFSVQNLSTNPADAIVSVTFDWVNAPGQGTMEFDTDQTGMNDLFEGGNSTSTTCQGTYRNGCDVATGLIYDGQNTVPSTPCDPTANTGWIGTNPTTLPDGWKTLEFRFNNFTNGKVFEFDVDTDGGLGINGGSMRGMVVIIKNAGGQMLTGNLVEVSTTLSEARF